MTSVFLAADGAPHAAYLVLGEDPGLVSQALSALLVELESLDGAGAGAVEEYGPAGSETNQAESFPLGPVVDACRTPPFLAAWRVVVVRDANLLEAAPLRELVACIADPLPRTVLVVVYTGRRAPAALTEAIRTAGRVVEAEPAPNSRARTQWFAERLRRGPVRLSPPALELLEEHLGEDLARLDGLLGTLEAAFGTGATVEADELAPFLGTAGGVASWDLTDAIDAGDVSRALALLARLLGPGERSPFQVVALLHRHYGAMLRLDGSGISDEQSAAAATDLKPYPARKALTASRRLGHAGIARAIGLLADADLALRGESGWRDELVLEVLVARLARLSSSRAVAPRASRRARAR
ncbi:MAG TPA: DNA polymerase III subunit delta [Acidimicrobiales bacterium]|nr:DNA polymerase III subunit delta [Acidimicrobiales bacterium]